MFDIRERMRGYTFICYIMGVWREEVGGGRVERGMEKVLYKSRKKLIEMKVNKKYY